MSEQKELSFPCLMLAVSKDQVPHWTDSDKTLQRALLTCPFKFCYWYHNQVRLVALTEEELNQKVVEGYAKCFRAMHRMG